MKEMDDWPDHYFVMSGKDFQKIREAFDLSQKHLAEKFSERWRTITRSVIQRIESMKLVQPIYVKILADCTGVVDWQAFLSKMRGGRAHAR